MRRGSVLRLAYRLNAYLNAKGPGKLKPVRRARQVAKRLFARLHAYKGLVPAEVDGQPMFVRPEFAVDYITRPYEPVTTKLFKAALRPGATVLDIGAQFGYYSLIAAGRVGPRGKVYAFEPGPDNLEILKLNVAMSGYSNIVPVQKAVTRKNAPVDLHMARCTACHSLYTHPLAPTEATLVVEGVTIDRFLQGQRVDVIKMDIEGDEPFALEGMKETISRSPSLVLFTEFSPEFLRQLGVEPQDFLAELEGLGFEVQLIDEDAGCATPVQQDRLLEIYYAGAWSSNFYCLKRAQ